MKLLFFTIPVFGPGPEIEELNRALATERVVAIDRQLVQAGAGSAWAVCVTVAGGARESTPAGLSRESKVDWKAVLPPEQFEVYARLRLLRKVVAEREGVPPYAVFNNEQLAEIVRRGVRNSAELGAIPGVGAARVEKYGVQFLAELRAIKAEGPGSTLPGSLPKDAPT